MAEQIRKTTGRSQQKTVVVPEMGRLQPQAPELEEAVLGALMLEKDAYSIVSEILKPECFYEKAHELIYAAIVDLAVQQLPIDMMTVTEQLRKRGDLDQVGGPYYIAQLTSKVASSAHIEYHARIIAQKYLARELISFSSQIQSKAFDETTDVDDLMQEAEGKLFEISQRNVKKDVTQINPVIKEALKMLENAANQKEGLSGLRTGFDGLDKITSGWQNSDLVIIAARPAMGKTAFVLSMAKNMAVNFNTPVALFSLEMSNVQLVNRLIVNVCEIPGEKIKSGRLEKYEWEQMDYKIKELYDAPIYVDDTPSLSVFELRTKARRLVREHDIKCIIIDYLQLMNASGMSFGSREQEVSMISRSLKGLCFIHRPEYYKITEDERGNSLVGLAEIIIAKHRNGATGDVRLRFKSEFAKFMNIEDDIPVQEFRSGNQLPPDTAGAQEQALPPTELLTSSGNNDFPF